ncbi:TPA: hypothetical protein EYP84_05965, partial [Candidatus Bipolaricaulota bacterium]|nr:hypothetical protein [Candidatus Bipolaricaulota bacterium]
MSRAIWLISLIVLFGCAVNPVTQRQEFLIFSEGYEIRLGREAQRSVLLRFGRYTDQALQGYVSEVGQRIATLSHRPHLAYRFTVTDSSVLNAMALPGGFIYVNRGLLAYLNSEAQLAGVLGHEIGHVAARHGIKHYQAALGAQLLSIGVAALTESRGLVLGTNLLLEAILKGYSRRDEYQADELGMLYMYRAGYDPSEMVKFLMILQGLERREPNLVEQLFSSHPLTSDRVARAKTYAAELGGRRRGLSVGRDRYLRHLDGMVFGPGKMEGVIEGRRFRNRHFRYELKAPRGWSLRRGERIGSVEAVHPSGNLRCQAIPLQLQRPLSPYELAQQVERGSGLQRLWSSRVLLGGLHGLKVDYVAGRIRARIAYLVRGRTGFILCCSAPRGLFPLAEAPFEGFLRSFRSLSPEEAEGIP